MSWIIVNIDRPPRFEIRDSGWHDAPDESGEQWQEIIATVCDPDNARLIAAAPALLAVSQKLDDFQLWYAAATWGNDMPGNDLYSSQLMEIVIEARAAIALARSASEEVKG